jgi:hypothetical protein
MDRTAARAAFHEIRSDAGGHLIALGIQMAGHRSGCGEAGIGQWRRLDEVEGDGHFHGAFDGGAAHFAVALRGMGVAHGK